MMKLILSFILEIHPNLSLRKIKPKLISLFQIWDAEKVLSDCWLRGRICVCSISPFSCSSYIWIRANNACTYGTAGTIERTYDHSINIQTLKPYTHVLSLLPSYYPSLVYEHTLSYWNEWNVKFKTNLRLQWRIFSWNGFPVFLRHHHHQHPHQQNDRIILHTLWLPYIGLHYYDDGILLSWSRVEHFSENFLYLKLYPFNTFDVQMESNTSHHKCSNREYTHLQ